MLSFWQLTFVVDTFIHVHDIYNNAEKFEKWQTNLDFDVSLFFKWRTTANTVNFFFYIGCTGQE